MRAAGTDFAAGRWSIAASMATPARRSCGSNWRSSWSCPRPHATGPMLRPVVVGIDTGGHYGPQVAEFCKVRGGGYQPLKGLPAAAVRGRPGAAIRDRRQPGEATAPRA